MGELIQMNIRGIKTESQRKEKVSLTLNFLDKHNLKFLNIQETRLQNKNEIPKDFTHLEHLYNIVFCGTDETDPGAGILFFVKKTEEILIEKSR